MRTDELDPDGALASALDEKVSVSDSETESHTIRCYAEGKMPQTGLGDEFIALLNNGPVKSKTQDGGPYKGNIAMTVYCRLLDDGTVKRNRIREIIGQCSRLTQGRLTGGILYRVDPGQVVTPVTVDERSGYALKTVGVEWKSV